MSWLTKTVQLALAPEARAFRKKLRRPRRTQQALLSRLVADLARTEFGRFHKVYTGSDFFLNLPISRYEDLAERVIEQSRTSEPILTNQRVIFYERTSGSGHAAKLIPYTAALRDSFSRLFRIWAHDLLARGPGLRGGRIYISISPNFNEDAETESGVPVGLDSDADYLSGWIRPLIDRFLVPGQDLRSCRDPDEFRRRLSLRLLGSPELEVISVWNPSYLTVLLEFMTERAGSLALEAGEALSAERRAALEAGEWGAVWPELRLVSCWDQGAARHRAEELQTLFPGAMVQGKGLLATEAPVTLPLIDLGRGVPLLDEVFLEFEDDQGRVRLLHEVEEGSTYGLIITNRAGLWRYRLGDRVRIDGYAERTPRLVFVGRGESCSDLVGEKLDEILVSQIFELLGLHPGVSVLVPQLEPREHYCLVTPTDPGVDELEGLLCESYHYRQARRLGQLAPARVHVCERSERLVEDAWRAEGRSLGDLKPRALWPRPWVGEPGRTIAAATED